MPGNNCCKQGLSLVTQCPTPFDHFRAVAFRPYCGPHPAGCSISVDRKKEENMNRARLTLTTVIFFLFTAVAFAGITRTPIAEIPGPIRYGTCCAPVAAQNGILAVSYVFDPHVYLYSIPNWSAPVATLTISDSNAVIDSIAVQDDYIAVGAVDPTNNYIGAVYVFAKPNDGWQSETETAVLTPSNPANTDFFGYSVSVWGNTLLALGGEFKRCLHFH
jgi:hypothetical protein